MFERTQKAFWRRVLQVLPAVVLLLLMVSQFVPLVRQYIIGQNLWPVITIVLLTEILRHVNPHKDFRIYQDEAKATADVMQYVEKHRPRQADLLECSSYTIESLIDALGNAGCKIHLLLKHPDGEDEFQRQRIMTRIEYLLSPRFSGHDTIDIRCYRSPCSLRGRNLDHKLCLVGWYTYTGDANTLEGHTNPLIWATYSTPEGYDLQQMFDRAFQILWNHPSTVPAKELIKRSA